MMEIFSKPVIEVFVLIENEIFPCSAVDSALEDLSDADGFSRVADIWPPELQNILKKLNVLQKNNHGCYKAAGYDAFYAQFCDLYDSFCLDKSS
jgi:hypothetical protein